MQTNLPRQELPVLQAKPPEAPRSGVSAAIILLPLRLFLGVSFIAAGLDKLTDPQFFDPKAAGYIGNQLAGFAPHSPVGWFLTNVAVPNATLFGATVLAGELAIGLGTLVGLFSRTAAIFGFILSITLWLTASWEVAPFFLGSDLPYAIGWLTLALAAAHPVWSLDGQLKKRLAPSQPAYRLQDAPADSGMMQADNSVLQGIGEEEQPVGVARRRFIMVAGATVLSGAVTGVAWFNSLASKAEAPALSLPEASTPSQPATQPTTVASTPAQASQPTTAASTNAAAASTAPVATKPPATKSSTGPTAPATTTAPQIKGTIVGTLATMPVGEARNFTTPDTKESAILIHASDGLVKAFSTVCTHEGCDVGFNKTAQALVCPCHGAQFDIRTGAATRRPARTPLKSFNVQVDSSGNIVYVQAK